MQNLTGAA